MNILSSFLIKTESPKINRGICLFIFILAALAVAPCFPYLISGDVRAEQAPFQQGTPVYTYRIVRVHHHDPRAFTQGLLYHGGYLYESTGLHSRSSLRKVDIKTGRVLKIHRLSGKYFGEGIALHGKRIFQLTWQSRTGFIYDPETLRRTGKFSYDTEGWGITSDGIHLIMSDGSSILRFIDPDTFRVSKKIEVRESGKPISGLNELEYVRGEIYANMWNEGSVARISPETGEIRGWIDLRGLYGELGDNNGWDVLNGIAYDMEKDRLFVTGKFWPKLFEIKIIMKSP